MYCAGEFLDGDGISRRPPRIADTLLRALVRAIPAKIPAASHGTMNNLKFGGCDLRRAGAPFAYYETIADGMGAARTIPGIAARRAL